MIEVQIPLEEYTRDWIEYAHFAETKSIAEHYNIFKDLYDTGYFYSYLHFPISYQADDNKQINVKYGNRISAAQVCMTT
jgi:large subunit ribosomal protein L38